jgi:hypothetical protein
LGGDQFFVAAFHHFDPVVARQRSRSELFRHFVLAGCRRRLAVAGGRQRDDEFPGFVVEPRGGRERDIPATPKGVVYVARATGLKGISPEWRGRVRNVLPPSVEGEIRAGGAVAPVPGRWVGGWGAGYSQLQLAACSDPAGTDCSTLTAFGYLRPCAADDSFVLPASAAGRYLRVANRQLGEAQPEPDAITGPGEEVWAPSRNTAVAMVGQIQPALGPVAGQCGPPVAPRAWISTAGTASVECQAGCTAELVATRAGRRRQAVGIRHEGSALWVEPLELRLTTKDLRYLGAGRAQFALLADGQTLARRTVRIKLN